MSSSSSSSDRVAAPTNGHRPAMSEPELDAPPAASTDVIDEATGAPPGRPTAIPVSPAQLAVGFGVVAALILFVLGRRRGRRD